jgi:predicted ATPase
VEEMTKSVLESGVLKDVDGHYELTGSIASLSVPATLQDSLMARLDRLVTAKAVAQYAAVIGRQFSYELLHAVSQLDEATLQRELGRLVEAELVFQRGTIPQATYMFKHALIQDTAYESLLRSTRQGYHRRIADFLAERFPETGEIHPELLAYHYTEAGLNDEAIGYWQQAGEQAVQRSAHVEAISHIQNGLTLLQNIPISEKRAQQELDLQIVLGPALMATTGHHTEEVGRVYTRARELCQQVGETPQLFSALSGLHRFYFVRGLMPMARELGEQFLHLAQGRDDPALSLTGHWLLGSPLLMLGEVVSAHEHIERSLSLYDPIQHHSLAFRYGLDPGSASSAYTAMTLWVLGFPDQALRRSLEALTLAQERTHPFSLGYVLHIVACLACLRRDWSSASEYVDTGLTLAHEHGFPAWLLFGSLLQGWTRVGQGQLDVGITQQQENLATFQATGTELLMPWLLIELADAHKKAGRPDEGRLLLGEALDNMSRTEQRFWESEVYRLQGECLFALPVPDTSKAESCFQRAISIAQNQSAKSWELRAATSLAKLWQGQGKRQEAYDLLDPVYSWFTEGFDTADLIDAKALLDELS